LPADVQPIARRKLRMLNNAKRIDDLRIPLNKQWRICFKWREGNVHDAEIVDYH